MGSLFQSIRALFTSGGKPGEPAAPAAPADVTLVVPGMY
jgi:hypothetical protein